jgi:WD40 repeat protein
LWNAKTRKQEGETFLHDSVVYKVVFSRDPKTKTIASGSLDKTLRLWSINNSEKEQIPTSKKLLEVQKDSVRSVAFSHDGKQIVSGSWDGTIQLWDAEKGIPKGKPIRVHDLEIHAVAFSPDGKTIATGSADKTIRLWDVDKVHKQVKQVGKVLKGHTKDVYSITFHPKNPNIIASGSWDGTVRLWNVSSGEKSFDELKVKGRTSPVYALAFSPNGETLASANNNKEIMLWDTKNKKQKGKTLTEHRDAVHSVAFSPDGGTLASASLDQTIILWDVKKDISKRKTLQGHENVVYSVAFSPDGKIIVSGGRDNTIRTWDAKTGEQLGYVLKKHEDAIYSIAFNPKSKSEQDNVIASSSDRYLSDILLWKVSKRRSNLNLKKNLCEWLTKNNHSAVTDPKTDEQKEAKKYCDRIMTTASS